MNREEPACTGSPSRWGALFSADGWVLFLAPVAARLYLGVLLCLALTAVLPVLVGWHGTVVQSGSMEPHISAGDVVLAAGFGPGQRVPVGGVVEFISPAAAEPGGVEKIRLHRIVAENPDGTFVTAGDANADVDSTPLERGQITGQARLLVPSIGLPGLWLGGREYPALAWWSLLTLLAVASAVFSGRTSMPGDEGDVQRDNDTSRPNPSRPQGSRQRRKAAVAAGVVAVLAVLVIVTSTAFSSAAFTASTANAVNTFGTAADWTPPSVTVTDPGPTVRGTVTVTAEAADAETGVRQVALQYLPPNGAWTTLCTVVAAPYSCSWNTPGSPDGSYDLRAVATDNAGLTSTSAVVRTAVSNTFAVILTDPGEVLRSNVNLSTALLSPGSTPYTVRVEYSPAGTGRWSVLCQNLPAPYNCTWATGTFANDSYDLRAVAVSGNASTYSNILTDVLVDNLAPTVTMTDPGTPLRGTGTFAAAAADAHSGIAQVQLQYTRSGTTAWTPLCTVGVPPYSCRFDTTALANASYSFRAIATDEAGNTTISALIANRVVDNTVSSVSVEDPGAFLTGSTTLTAAANAGTGITGIRIQTAPAGTGTWTTRCTLAAAPYSCAWDTRTVADGLYDIRAILTDGAGRETVSAIVTGRRVDNSPLRGVDVQTTNSTGIPGRPDAGDAVSFTYSQQVNLATVTPGWTGAGLPVTVRLRDGNILGTGGSGDTLDVQRPGSTVNLGPVNTKGDFVKNRRTVTYNATMTAATITVAGIPRTVVTVTLGGVASGEGSIRTSSTAAAMVWSPTASVTGTGGLPSSTAPVTETGALDQNF